MPKLTLDSANTENDAATVFKIYSLAFKDYHDKVAELEGSGTVELDQGAYKVEAINGKLSLQKVVLLKNNVSTLMNFADRYGEIDITRKLDLKKALAVGLVAGFLAAVLLYTIGFDLLANYITL